VGFLKRVWGYLSGKKTTAGAALLLGAELLPESITQNPEVVLKVAEGVAIVGLLHKVAKKVRAVLGKT
jgi:hypothetical protein